MNRMTNDWRNQLRPQSGSAILHMAIGTGKVQLPLTRVKGFFTVFIGGHGFGPFDLDVGQHAIGQGAHVGSEDAHGLHVIHFQGFFPIGYTAVIECVMQGHYLAFGIIKHGVVACNLLAAVGETIGVSFTILEWRFPHFAAFIDHAFKGRKFHDGVVLRKAIGLESQCAINVVIHFDVGVFLRVMLD